MASDLEVLYYDVFLVGNTGVGKSASGNTLLGGKKFNSRKSSKPVTLWLQKESMKFDEVPLTIYDTPGLFNPETQRENDFSEWKNLLRKSTCPVILLVMKADGVSQEEERAADLIEAVIPEEFIQNVWILFTRGDELEREDLTIEEFIEDSHQLKEIVERFGNRYHVFNNNSKSPQQVRILIRKIIEAAETISLNNGTSTPPDRPDRRIVLVGKTGVGKSATGNTILGETKFRSEISSSSVTSESELEDAEISGRKISVIDTPGLFDTNLTKTQLSEEIGRSIYLSRPGPHAFLYIQPVNIRFTKQEENVLEKLELIFGENLRKYTIIVFTHGDQLKGKSVDEIIQENPLLSKVIEQCGGRYHIINNTQRNKQQVPDLLQKIDRMVEENRGRYYTSEMFQGAQRFKTFKEFYQENKKTLLVAAGVGGGSGVVSGVVTGASVGLVVGGPAGAAIGAAIGAGVGVLVGAATGSAVVTGMHVREKRQERRSSEQSREKRDSTTDPDESSDVTEFEKMHLL